MKEFEDKMLTQLQAATSKEGFLALLTASQIMDSRELYARGVRGLAGLPTMLSEKEAENIGIKTFYDIAAHKCT
jgi:hypothetical protein